MDTPTKLALVTLGIVVTLSLGVANVYASSWDGNPLAGLDNQNEANISYHPDYKKDLKPKSYSWGESQVCGLELCRSYQGQHLQNEQTNAPNTLGDRFGMSAKAPEVGFLEDKFDGNFFIKGYFPSPFLR